MCHSPGTAAAGETNYRRRRPSPSFFRKYNRLNSLVTLTTMERISSTTMICRPVTNTKMDRNVILAWNSHTELTQLQIFPGGTKLSVTIITVHALHILVKYTSDWD